MHALTPQPLSSPHRHYPQSFQIVSRNIQKTSKKYSTSDWFYFVQNTNQYLSKRKSRAMRYLDELVYDKEEEMIEKYYPYEEGRQEMKELLQYYKYYTQTSITFQKGFFKVLHSHRERKKKIEYNRLKAVLNFSKETHETSTEREKKQGGTDKRSYFNLLSSFLLSFDHQESMLIERLKCNLERQLGPNCHPTLEQIDKNYRFQRKKLTQQSATPSKLKSYGSKQNMGIMIPKKASKQQRNKSCETIIGNSKRNQSKCHKKSITNLYSPPKSAFNIRKSLPSSPKPLSSNTKITKHTQTKESRLSHELSPDIKFKIGMLKDQLKKQKHTLKKKLFKPPKSDKKGRSGKS